MRQIDDTGAGRWRFVAIRNCDRLSRQTIELVNSIGCESCEVIVPDMHDSEVAKRAKQFGVRSVPAAVINGQLADCCTGRGVDTEILRALASRFRRATEAKARER